MDISGLRQSYDKGKLDEADAGTDPNALFARWFEDARALPGLEPNAMTLATADRRGRPSARVVLLKEFDESGLVWFTNYDSRKGADLADNPQATLLLGQARGACLAALVSQQLPVAEYTALQMKKAVAGHGRAAKSQIQEMVRRLLQLSGLPGTDAADALGLAITHAHAGSAMAQLAKTTALQRRTHALYKSGRSY